jgi:hypothetical protein
MKSRNVSLLRSFNYILCNKIVLDYKIAHILLIIGSTTEKSHLKIIGGNNKHAEYPKLLQDSILRQKADYQ